MVCRGAGQAGGRGPGLGAAARRGCVMQWSYNAQLDAGIAVQATNPAVWLIAARCRPAAIAVITCLTQKTAVKERDDVVAVLPVDLCRANAPSGSDSRQAEQDCSQRSCTRAPHNNHGNLRTLYDLSALAARGVASHNNAQT